MPLPGISTGGGGFQGSSRSGLDAVTTLQQEFGGAGGLGSVSFGVKDGGELSGLLPFALVAGAVLIAALFSRRAR